MDFSFPEYGRMIQMAGPEDLEECGNEAYMEAHGTIELLKGELASCKVQVEMLMYILLYFSYVTDQHARGIVERTIILKAPVPEAEDRSIGTISLPPLGKNLKALSWVHTPQ
jgi:hypothetical protein